MTKQYLDLARTVLETGATKHDRTGTGTKSIFGYQMRFDLAEGFPILTTKKVAFGLIKSELLWFLKGDTNIKYLLENNNHIWDEWAFERYVQSADYTGPNMEDFGHRVLKEEGTANWATFMGPNGAAGKRRKGNSSIKSAMSSK